MTPAEIITRKLKARIEESGATVPVVSLLLEALEGARHEAPSSFIALSVQIAAQLEEPLPHYRFDLAATLVTAIDDDKGGQLFKANHDALWTAFDYLARADNCEELGGDSSSGFGGLPQETGGDSSSGFGGLPPFLCDGLQLGAGVAPQFSDDEDGGSWTVTFSATVTGRAN